MRKSKLKVSVGISAYKEEKNIQNVLNEILEQVPYDSWELLEILVYVDGNEDSTAEKVKEMNSKFIKIYDNIERKGKAYRLSQMFRQFEGDILIMFDADIKINESNVISLMVQPFNEDKLIMLVGGNSQAIKPQSFFQEAVYSTFKVFYESRRHLNNGNNIFGCTGSVLAIRREFAKEINCSMPVNEDAYLYLLCLKSNYKFKYVDDAVVYYKMPTNIMDYGRQVLRSEPEAVSLELEKYFGDLSEMAFRRPLGFYFRCILKEFFLNPLGVSCMVVINVFCKLLIPVTSKYYRLEWFTAQSTKSL